MPVATVQIVQNAVKLSKTFRELTDTCPWRVVVYAENLSSWLRFYGSSAHYAIVIIDGVATIARR